MRIPSLFAGLGALSLSLVTLSANADPCGNFNLANLLSGDCKIEVSGGCSAQCQPINFEVGCTGGCTAMAQSSCSSTTNGTCGTQCVAMCDPKLLDCFEGCHTECDAPVIAQCKSMGGNVDCSAQAKAQCDIHCKDSCKVPVSSGCQEHCTKCCTGACSTQVNFACDYKCFADLKGGCDVQCAAPKGAIFCKGQYVHASDVDDCITYMLTKGISVSASATLTCGLTGCSGLAKAGAGLCSSSGVDPVGTGLGVAGMAALAVMMVAGPVRRRRRAKAGAGR